MRNPEGDRPGGAPPAPKPMPNPGPPRAIGEPVQRRMYSDLPAEQRLRVVEILRPGWNKALAKYAERKRAEAAEHVRAA